MRHFLTTTDWSIEELDGLLNLAHQLKQNPVNTKLSGRSIALLFLNPSLRTRASFELGMQQMGGIAIIVQPGRDAWGVEFKPGAVMDGEAEEHIAEVAGVLSRYCDLIGSGSWPARLSVPFTPRQLDHRSPSVETLAFRPLSDETPMGTHLACVPRRV